MRFSLLVALVASVAASPYGQQKGCAAIDQCITKEGQQAAATAFCSSYLHVPASTVTKTAGQHGGSGGRTVTVYTSTTTVSEPASATTTTTTTTLTALSTVTDSTTVTTGTATTATTVTTTCQLPPSSSKLRKRHAPAPSPGCFKGYTSPWSVTSACRCLRIEPSTTTTTVTQPTGHGYGSTTTVSTVTTVTVTTASTVTKTSTVSTASVTTTTITSSVDTTTTLTSTTATSPASFYLYATPVASYGQLLYDETTSPVGYIADTVEDADIFNLDPVTGDIIVDTGSPGYEGVQDNSMDPENLYFTTPAGIVEEEAHDPGLLVEQVPCTITSVGDGSCTLQCTDPFGGGTVQSLFDYLGYEEWDLGSSSAGTAFVPLVIDSGT